MKSATVIRSTSRRACTITHSTIPAPIKPHPLVRASRFARAPEIRTSVPVRHATTATSPIEKHAVHDENPPTAGPSYLPSSTDLLEVYRGMVAQGRLAWDEEQVRVVMKVKSVFSSTRVPPLAYSSSSGTCLKNWQTTNRPSTSSPNSLHRPSPSHAGGRGGGPTARAKRRSG